jgi:hypothetical protein
MDVQIKIIWWCMVRNQIRLVEKQLKALRQCSAESGRSVADLVREGVDLYLSSQEPSRDEQIRRARAASGKFASGAKDASVRHDHYLAEAFREWLCS